MAQSTAASAIEIPPIISVDDHVIEPPHVWQSRLPSHYADIEWCGPSEGRLTRCA